MVESQAPDAAYGECLHASTHVLNTVTMPHVADASLSRNEKFAGKLLPGQHARLRVAAHREVALGPVDVLDGAERVAAQARVLL